MLRRRWFSDGHSAPVYSCCTDGRWIYSSSGDRFVTRWNPETGAQDAFAVKLDSPAYTIFVSGNVLFIGCNNGAVIAIALQDKKLLWERNFRGKAIFSFADCIAGHDFLIAADETGELLLISPQDGSLIAGFPLGCGKIRQMRIKENRFFLACQDGFIRVLELPSFNELSRFFAHREGVNALAVFPSSHMLVTAGRDAHIRVFDLVTEKELQSLPAHYQNIYGLEKLGDQLVSASMDKTIKLWDAAEMKVLQRIEAKNGGHGRSVNGCVAVGEDAIVTWGDDRRIIFWDRD
jgi:WD40 repeat protein